MDFSQVLRERRASRRLSQLELALRAGTTQRHVSFIESGRSAPGREMVIRLGESLELPLRSRHGDLSLMTTITSFATAVDVTISELKLEAFLPADSFTASVLFAENHPGRLNAPEPHRTAAGFLEFPRDAGPFG